MRTGLCFECGEDFDWEPKVGAVPPRCRPCAREHDLQRGRERAQQKRGERALRTNIRWLECKSCGRATPRAKMDVRNVKAAICTACADKAWCSTCDEVKSKADFYKVSTLPNGVSKLCKTCTTSYKKTLRQRNPERYRALHIKQAYGLTLERWNEMLQAQGGRCAICRRTEEEAGRFHVDHCHTQGHVRSLLCGNCNAGIGHFRDDPDLLRAAADYVSRIPVGALSG